MWFWIEIGNPAAGGGAILLLAFAMLAVLFLTPIVGTVIAIRSFIHKEVIPGIIALVVALAAAGYLVGSYIASRIESKEYHRESERLIIETVNKENVDEDTFAFTVKVTNNTVERIVRTDIEMVVFNYANQPLLSTKMTDIDCDTGVTKDFRLLVDAGKNDKAEELFFTDYQYLRIEITIRALDYNDRDPDDYQFNDHRVLKTVDTQALEQEYHAALALFNAAEYRQAIEKFSRLGGYGDSLTKRKTAIEILEEKEQNATEEALRAQYEQAIALYNQGSYAASQELFEALGDYADSPQWVIKCQEALEDQQIEQQYFDAKALLESKEYARAYYAFYAIREYRDSQELMTAIVAEVERLSLEYADEGRYDAAYELLSDMGYTTTEQDANYLPILKAYQCAKSGDYKSAILYGLTKIVLPEGITQIGASMFEGCDTLVEVVIPDTVTEIGAYAFSGCKKLTGLILPSRLQTVGRSAFANCDGLEKLVLPLSLQSIETYGLNSLDCEIYYDGTVAQWAQVQKNSGGGTFHKVVHCIDGDAQP